VWRNDNGAITTWLGVGNGFDGAGQPTYFVGNEWALLCRGRMSAFDPLRTFRQCRLSTHCGHSVVSPECTMPSLPLYLYGEDTAALLRVLNDDAEAAFITACSGVRRNAEARFGLPAQALRTKQQMTNTVRI
jgi:hypothetical protein